MGGHEAIEVAKTVMEVADAAWTAMETCHHLRHHHDDDSDDVESVRAENQRLRALLDQNLSLLRDLSDSPSLCPPPPDLHARLVATVDSESFLDRIKSLQPDHFPFNVPTEADIEAAEVMVNVDHEEPSWWVWVPKHKDQAAEERSGLADDDSYVVVSEEHVVDGVANFMAKCILSNPNARKMPPEELQKVIVKALGGVSKLHQMFEIWHAGKLLYALGTWGLALTGLYQTRAVLKLAAMGVHTTSKVVLRAL